MPTPDGNGGDPNSGPIHVGSPGGGSNGRAGGTGTRGGGAGTSGSGIVTRGGGYTDPGPDDGFQDTGGKPTGSAPSGGDPEEDSGGNSGKGSGGDSVAPSFGPGFGLTDPVPPASRTGEGGYGFWGGYTAPLGNELDHFVNAISAGEYIQTTAPPLARTISSKNGVRVEALSGTAPAGYRVDGLFGAIIAEAAPVRVIDQG